MARNTGLARRARWLGESALCCAVVLACRAETAYDPYLGPAAYPNRRASHAAEGRRLGYVSNSLSDTISIVDLDAFEVLADVPVGRDPVGVDGPHHLAVDARASLLFVALSYPERAATGPHAGHGSSTRNGYLQVLGLDDLRPLAELEVEYSPGDIYLAPDRSTLAVTHFDLTRAQRERALEDRRAALFLIDSPASMPFEAPRVRQLTLCVAPHGIGYSADGRRVFVACTGEDAIAVVDAQSGSVVQRVAVSDATVAAASAVHQPYSAVVNPAGDALAVGNIGSNSLVVFDVAEELVRRYTVPMLGAAYFPSWSSDGSALLVPFQSPGGLALLDAASGEILHQASYRPDDCQNPHDVDQLADGRVFLVCEGDHETPGGLVEVDPGSLEIIAVLPVGVYPDRLVVIEP